MLYLWENGTTHLLYGTPLEKRQEGEQVKLPAIFNCEFTAGDRALLFCTALFDDAYGLGYLPLAEGAQVQPVAVKGVRHSGVGELVALEHLKANRYTVTYNIDGCSWLYEGIFDEAALIMTLETVICGAGQIANGVLESRYYDKGRGAFSLSYSTATSPTQVYTIPGGNRATRVAVHTNERVLGVAPDILSPGEDASFTSFDGLRISARLYLPAPDLAFSGPATAGLLRARRSAEPGATGLCLVLHAAHPVPDHQWLCCVCTQRTRQQRLWPELHETRRS